MANFDYFGTLTNLLISLTVAIYGMLTWLKESGWSNSPQTSFRRRAYFCWWASWLAWVCAWALILAEGIGKTDSIYLRILTLVFDNINSIFLILIFLALTRGNAINSNQIRLGFAWIAASLGACIAVLYGLSPWLGVGFAFEVHRTWGLCLSVITPIMVGWAFNLRFNTVAVLAVGFAYGFIQPVVYSAEIHATGPIADVVGTLRPVTAMTLAGLKVAWAIVFMQVLELGVSSGLSLVEDMPSKGFNLLKSWNRKLAGQAIVLLAVYTLLLIRMFEYYVNSLEKWAVALGIVGGIIALLDWFWKLWGKAAKYFVDHRAEGAPPAG